MQSGLNEEVFDKPITIFAPDNAAFAEFTKKSLSQLEQFSVPELKRIITKHIIPGTYQLKDLQNLKVRKPFKKEVRSVQFFGKLNSFIFFFSHLPQSMEKL